MSSDAPALLPTSGIKDPDVKAFLDRLKVAWNHVTAGDNRFVSVGDFASMASQAAADMLSGGVTGGASGPIPGSSANALALVTDAIRTSIVYQLLDSQVSVADINAVRQAVDDAVQQASAGMSTETTTRQSQDMAIASAINRIWGYIGGSTAVFTDGTLAAATPSAATATKWNSVISAVTDPNTGNIASASILQETRTYANNTDSTLNALYSVRAQIASGGQTVVGGFGLAATAGAGSAQGPTIGFGVLANTFFIAAPSSGYDPVSQYGANLQNPFIVVTTPSTINGVTYPAGVYLKNAVIGQAAIDNAKIGQNIFSSNFNGTFFAGNISGFGTTGWAVSKDGTAVFNNVKVRGDVQASSLTTNSVFTANINGDQVTVARYVDAYDLAAVNSNLAGFTFLAGDITTSAVNSQGAPIMVEFDARRGEDGGGSVGGGQLWVQFLRDGSQLFQGDARDMPHSFSSDGASHTYTMRFGNVQYGVTSRYLKVQSFIR